MCTNLHFADLNILHDPDDPHMTLLCVRKAIELGFDAVAVNNDVGDLAEELLNDTQAEPPRKKKKKGGRKMKGIPQPFLVDEARLDLAMFQASGKKFRQYSRITASITDSAMVHTFLNHQTVKKYDIVAVRPQNEQMLMSLTSKADSLEMMCFDPTEKAPWISKGKIVQMAVAKGLSFELIYSPALTDSSTRREVFSNARILLGATKAGKGVVLSSAADRPIEIRAPLDVANLVTLFDATPEIGRKTVSGNPKQVLLRADTKKSIKGAMLVQKSENSLQKDIDLLMKVPEFRAQIEMLPKD